MKEPIWLTQEQVLAFHEDQLAEHGGKSGIRDVNVFESALGKPQNLFAYETPDLFDLAAAYAFGISRNHPFLDGNKRTAFVCAYVFLGLNGKDLTLGELEATDAMLKLASGSMKQDVFAKLLRDHHTDA